jgi:hypothetical protein
MPIADTQVWSKYRIEYVSPVIWMAPTSKSLWTLDFSLANRGPSEESFCIVLTEFYFAPGDFEVFEVSKPLGGVVVPSGQVKQ